MNQITIKQIDQEHEKDINLPNQPFQIYGKLIPSLTNGKWSYHTEKFAHSSEQCFPDENYQYDPRAFYFGAYDQDECVGLAILKYGDFKYLYLDDLKVNQEYRKQGIASRLIIACIHKAQELQMTGIYTIGQDNNLAACLFYLKNGFEIGGFNNRDYRGTLQENKADIYFYLDC